MRQEDFHYGEYVKIWNNTVVAYLKVPPWNSRGEIDRTHLKIRATQQNVERNPVQLNVQLIS